MTLCYVLHDTVGHQVPDRVTDRDPGPAGGRGDRHRGHLDQADGVGRQVRVGQLDPGPGAPDEGGEGEKLLRVTPRQDTGERVRAGDEEQFGATAVLVAEVADRVHRVGRARSVDVDAADPE